MSLKLKDLSDFAVAMLTKEKGELKNEPDIL
jgi:hypothetical protein